MAQKFTQNDLIRFIYKETSVAETLAIQELLNSDFDLYIEYQKLYWSYQKLPKVTFSPSQKTVDNILSYSQRSAQPVCWCWL